MKTSILIFMLFVGFMVIGSFGGIYFNYIGSKQVLIEEVNFHLETTVQSRANHINDFLEREKESLEVLARDHHFSDLLLGLTERSPLYGELNFDHYEEVLGSVKHEGYYEIFVLDENGKVVTTSNPEGEFGKDFSKDVLFFEAKEKTYIKDAFYDEEFGKNSIAISAPIKHKETNEFLGVIVARIEIDLLNSIVLDRVGLGETGEIYLINSEGYMITPSRFLGNEYTFLKLQVDTVNSINCLRMIGMEITEHMGHEPVNVFEDYRGVEVLGTHSYIPEMQWCLLAEIDESEALGNLRNKLLKTAFIVLIVIIVVMMVFILLSGYLIEKLVKESKRNKRK